MVHRAACSFRDSKTAILMISTKYGINGPQRNRRTTASDSDATLSMWAKTPREAEERKPPPAPHRAEPTQSLGRRGAAARGPRAAHRDAAANAADAGGTHTRRSAATPFGELLSRNRIPLHASCPISNPAADPAATFRALATLPRGASSVASASKARLLPPLVLLPLRWSNKRRALMEQAGLGIRHM